MLQALLCFGWGLSWVLSVSSLANALSKSCDEASPLAIGETFTIQSDVLGETRRINVYWPAAYEAMEQAEFPVLYMPDGGIHEDFLHIAGIVQISSLNHTMRPFLLVGIENTERKRDLTPETSTPEDRQIAPRVGGAEAFRSFLRDELRPVIDDRYRTTGETAIIGESLAGLFVVDTFLTEPDLFDTYLAVDASLWWDSQKLVEQAVSKSKGRENIPSLYLAASSQVGIKEPVATLAKALRGAFPEMNLLFRSFPEETHLSIYHPAALYGLRKMLPRQKN